MKNHFLKFICASFIIAGLASCSKDEPAETDCSSDIIASYNGKTDCQAASQHTGIITINSAGSANKVKISGIMYLSADPLNATVNCTNKTFVIPEQTVMSGPDAIVVSGSGTYTSNSVTINFTYNYAGSQQPCSGTYLR